VKYWTLFTLRMMARVGLFLAVAAWFMSQSGSFSHGITIASVHLRALSNESAMTIQLHRGQVSSRPEKGETVTISTPDGGRVTFSEITYSLVAWTQVAGFEDMVSDMPPPSRNPVVQVPSIKIWRHGLQSAAIQIDHWLVCLTFLIATVATSWRWKKFASVQENGA